MRPVKTVALVVEDVAAEAVVEDAAAEAVGEEALAAVAEDVAEEEALVEAVAVEALAAVAEDAVEETVVAVAADVADSTGRRASEALRERRCLFKQRLFLLLRPLAVFCCVPGCGERGFAV